MILVDSALQEREQQGRPVRVGLIGAGFMGRGIINQFVNYVTGMRLVAVSNRTVEHAREAFRLAGEDSVQEAENLSQLDAAINAGHYVVTGDAGLLCESDGIDVLVESTGHVQFGAEITLKAIDCGKHLVTMNAELDGTVGPILKHHADRAGVIFTGCDGDQPAVQMNLYRFVKSIGLTPLLCGNIKGLQDRYRNPTTQESFARQWGQTPSMVTSFADGTKISFEQAIVANATGMKVATRGMLGYEYDGHIDDMVERYDIDELKALGGIVDYVVGPKPSPGVFVYASNNGDTQQAHYLNYGKLGEGPLYSFYVPYHLTIFEVSISAARVALFGDRIISPLAGPVVDVVAAAKIDLTAGQTLDGLGDYMTYGLCENADIVAEQNLLPMGIAEGGRLTRSIAKDQVITLDDIELPANVAVELRQQQSAHFSK